MSTALQEKTAKIALNNPELLKDGNKGKLVELGGYGIPMQNNPAKVLESKGFKEEIRKLGLTEELITGALVEDIKLKPQNRVPEMRLGAEILGMNNREENQGGNKTLIINITGETAERYGLIKKDELNVK